MSSQDRTYIAIDLKSFFASVECVERGLDPLTAKLVVADPNRTEKTICLAVSPALKAYGIAGRARLFEVLQKVKEVKRTTGEEIQFIIAPPQMAKYIEYSSNIYSTYLKYVSAEDIHVYSIDECFIDVTKYLTLYKTTAEELAQKMILDVLMNTGITATAGIGSNLYLCKIAMDIIAKKAKPDKNGVRMGRLDEESYRRLLWDHQPITDFWRVGRGIAKRLQECSLNDGRGILTMGDIAYVSKTKPDALYKMLGIDAELLIDHAWGHEPCTIADIKRYKPRNNSIGTGQVLQHPYPFDKARIVVREMVDFLALELVDKNFVSNGFTLFVTYDRENVDSGKYTGDTVVDYYGRTLPKPAHGNANFGIYTASLEKITTAVMELFDRVVNPNLTIRKLNLTANNVVDARNEEVDLFTDIKKREREKKMQLAELTIKKKFGKNAILKGFDLQEGATTKERNGQIGGHKA